MDSTSYGINVANRYDLFAVDDDGNDPFQTVSKPKHRQSKKHGATPINVSDANSKPLSRSVKNVEKENKVTQTKFGNEIKVFEKQSEIKSHASSNFAYRNEKHGIKETQKDNIRSAREESDRKPIERRSIVKQNLMGVENREEKNNRKNRELNNDDNGQRKQSYGNKKFEVRGKREFDRQSGSNKTGVKAVEKRDGTGPHNWGSAKIDAKEFNTFTEDMNQNDTDEDKVNSELGKEEVFMSQENKQLVEEELREMTLDEYKAQIAAARSKPHYNLRKAGEGEDSTQWDKMIALNKKKAEVETEEENEIQKSIKQKQVLDIEFHFNDGRRGGMMGRARGRSGKSARNSGKRDIEKRETHDIREVDADKRDRRNRTSLNDVKLGKHNIRFKNSAPKVDDEHDFPSLG